MRYLTISLVLYLSIFWKATAQPTPMGRFVEDVKIEPLEIEIPTITRTKLLDRGEILSMGESFFPYHSSRNPFLLGRISRYFSGGFISFIRCLETGWHRRISRFRIHPETGLFGCQVAVEE